MSNIELRREILAELEFDPSVDAANIGVAVENGIVTLSGHVKSYPEKNAVEAAVKRVRGVRAVAEEVEVRHPEHKHHADDEIASRALDIISWDTALPDAAIDVKVQKGWITLSGEVPWQFQRMAAEQAVIKLGGVVGVANLITVAQSKSVSDVRSCIEDALRRSAEIEASRINVKVVDNHVVLEGVVRTWVERSMAEYAAWSVPGVTKVDSHLSVS